MPPTYFGSSSNPADNGTSSGTSLGGNQFAQNVTPPASMVAGDLAIMIGQRRNNLSVLTVRPGFEGGQTWNSIDAVLANFVAARIFWCRFNGTWSADPQVLSSNDGTLNVPMSVVMHVARPAVGSSDWILDAGQVESDFSVGVGSPIVISGVIASIDSVALASWFSNTANTWGAVSGTGWNNAGGSQYRNLAGSDQCATHAYRIQNSDENTGNATKVVTAAATGTTSILSWQEIAASGGGTRMLLLGVGR